MNSTSFCLEFDLDMSEIRKLNKMYFRGLFQRRVLFFLAAILLGIIFFDYFNLNNDNDLIEWGIRNLLLITFFLLFQYLFINTITKAIFQFVNTLLKSERFANKYKFNFTSSFICIHSPLGEFTHKWCNIEKAILTKDFFFLYFKDKNGYIVSISNKYENRNMNELVSFLENNVIPVTKI